MARTDAPGLTLLLGRGCGCSTCLRKRALEKARGAMEGSGGVIIYILHLTHGSLGASDIVDQEGRDLL